MRGGFLWILGMLGLLAFVAAGVLGYGALLQEALRVHVLVGLCACLLLLFSQGWIVIYLLGVARAARAWQRERLERGGQLPPLAALGDSDAFPRGVAAWSRRVLLAGALAVAAGLGSFALGGAALARSVPAALHHSAFYLALAAQAWALAVERRALAASDVLLASAGERLADDAA